MFFKKSKQKRFGKNIQEFIKRMEENQKEEIKKPIDERDIYPIATDAQLAVDCLCDLFLREDWYVVDPLSNKQINTIILDSILYKYCPEYRNYIKSKKK